MSLESVRNAYGTKANEYIELVGRIEHVANDDLALAERWARGIEGPVLDVGCGPGQWTHYLASIGVEAEGVDPVSEFIESAQAAYPNDRYRIGRAETLGVEDGSLGGVLAWYSLIHTKPSKIDVVLTEFARRIRPGGGLAIGFFSSSMLRSFEHAVTTAYYWPIGLLSSKVETAGFVVTHAELRTGRPARTHGAILAIRL